MNLRPTVLLTVAVIVIAFPEMIHAQSPFYIPVTITQSGNTTIDTFGVAHGATYCIDSTLGEKELFPNVIEVFDARFVDHRDTPCLGQGLRLDLQPASGIDTFQLQFRKGNGPYNFQISWPHDESTMLYSLIITDPIVHSLGFIDMHMASSVTITQPSISSVYIIASVGDDVKPGSELYLASFSLAQNYPNPFNPSTTISYTLPSQSFVTLKLFNVLGQEVASMVNGIESPGNKSVRFDGSGLPSGVYFYRLQAGSYSATKMLMIVR